MAGFEVVVRPAILPNIRPLPSRSLPPDDPDQGMATLSGSSAKMITLNYSYSGNASMKGGTETQRTYDVARIRPPGSGGGSSRSGESGSGDTYIDVEVVKKIRMQHGNGNTFTYKYQPIAPADNIEIIEHNQTRVAR